jgi:imidazolonepropionase-like amidohydrolase/Tol biopolymer transport system component
MTKKLLLAIMALAMVLPATAQKKKKKDKKDKDEKEVKWDVANPGASFNYQPHSFTTDEGTWMNLDVSPDGKTVVFDLMGDIYSMPISGGKANPLRTGIPFEVQPKFSPDGSKISFTSDAGGGDNIWIMDADGSDAKQVTKEKFRLLNNATWTADGQYLIARKHFTSGRSLGAGELWQYHMTGGSGLQLTKRKNDQQDVNEPSVSPDGKYLYYSEDVYPGGNFQYNKDPNKQIYVIQRYHFEDGKIQTLTNGPGGAARPTVSPDGKLLAFIKRVRTKTVLYIHDLSTGEEWPVYDALNKDQQEAWAIFGVYPNFDWMPNNEEIVFWSGGKINKVNIKNYNTSVIPFTADVTLQIAETVHFKSPVAPDEFDVKVIRHATTSPDGKTLVFSALGKLYKKALPNGKPQRITSQNDDFEFEPSFSADGKQLVYVTWNDENYGSIRTVSINGGTSQKLTTEKAIYRTPSFAFAKADNSIIYRKEPRNSDQGLAFAKKPGIYTLVQGQQPKLITQNGEYPTYSADGKRIFLQTGGTYFGNLTKSLISVNLEGNDERTHVTSKYANRLVPSPDNKWIAYTNLHKAFVAPLVMNGKTIDLDNNSKYVPVSQIAKDAGINIHWSPNSQKVMWTLGDQYFSNEIKNRFTFLAGSPDEVPEMDVNGIAISLKAKTDTPSGITAFTNARIITMEGDQVIENGTIVVTNNKITAIGENVTIPSGAKTIDVSGKTIMPGLVDAHAHVGAFRYGLPAQKHWPFYANLAFGVTTSHDPSANTETIFTLSELLKSGDMVGPRLYSTGFILYGADGDFKAVINSLDDARSAIRRTKAFGAKSVKSYNQPRREQRQQVMQAARELGINVVPEGGSTFYTNMTMIMDGHTGVEHNIPVAPVYKDVLELWSASDTGYTPTLIVNYAGVNGEFYFYQHDKVWENEKLLKYTPRTLVDARARHRMMIPDEEYQNGHILTSKAVTALANKGVKVNMGAHGQLQGLGAHWETWMLQQGGMTNLQALQAATINGAEYIGAGDDIGSLKVGKLADLIIIDGNPLENIRDSENVTHTMVNGRLYDTSTMNEVGNTTKKRGEFWWENTKQSEAFPWHEQSNSFTMPGCGCHVGHE